MKQFKKVLVGVAVSASLVTSAQAAMINIGGVMWDPEYALDFAGFSSKIRQDIAADGSLSGFGIISSMNNSNIAPGVGEIQMLAPGLQLTYTFGGFTLDPTSVTPTTTGQSANYTGGWLRLWVDGGTSVAPINIGTDSSANYGDGTLWLSLTAHTIAGISLAANTTATGANGSGAFYVIGGLAAGNFNTNQAAFGADLDFNASFTQRLGSPNPYSKLVGNASFGGNTIPEPGSLALLGLGLVGLAAMRKRQAK